MKTIRKQQQNQIANIHASFIAQSFDFWKLKAFCCNWTQIN